MQEVIIGFIRKNRETVKRKHKIVGWGEKGIRERERERERVK